MTEFIDIRGARENNLKDITLRIPKRQITIFTGVSGSGKSSIVFDTIATEAQRQLYENFSLFIRSFLPRYPPPEADAIENLSMAIIVDQKRLGGGSHSTVGTTTDIYTLLRLLFSRIGKPHVGYSNAFSFNDPAGMCRECSGLGKKLGVVSDDFLDKSKSLAEGAVQVPFFAAWELSSYAASGLFDKHKKLSKFTRDEMDLLLHSKPRKVRMRFADTTINVTFMGIVEKIERAYIKRDLKTLSERTQKAVTPYLRQQPCKACDGARLSQAALGCRIRGRNIADLSAMEIGDLIPVVRGDLVRADTLTAYHLQQALPIKQNVRKPSGRLRIKNARDNNLQNVSVDIPTGVLTLVTGVAGSGKSSLISEAFLRQYPEAIVIDQSAVGTSTRSNPATYTGVMDDVRKVFAAANKADAGLFSFNSKGACEHCKGSGVLYTDLAFLDAVRTPCETCHGRRFKEEVLPYTLDGKSISDVLALTVAEALDSFTQPPIVRKLEAMRDVGLHYLSLGQPLSTLSGGECQRIKLASELHKAGGVYVLDEPTTGLHLSDVTHLLAILDRLVDGGNSVIVIEHNMDVVRRADWIIDLGPEGGSKGGRVVFAGTPTELLKVKKSLTSQYLRPATLSQPIASPAS